MWVQFISSFVKLLVYSAFSLYNANYQQIGIRKGDDRV
ncbi:hypothetical protein HMPREF1250_0122 [Megasphaera vaginalis (ex Srinivasan et al. 2021)]|uniref:Uncharacterized protein n=1 Tax=Megasphaera vaginalis (ex Srinivasan et al. 2021) TaxID=1111454 RepID=U7UWA8_9FIRM|nr:hypothetical protein HMPREF1250_0122 [Megasphaera vaginalis (ex Srinivasan et al. 2021)]